MHSETRRNQIHKLRSIQAQLCSIKLRSVHCDSFKLDANRCSIADRIVRQRINGKRKWNLQVSKILFPFPLLLTTYIKVNVAFLFTLCGNLSWYAQKRRDQSLSSAKIGIHKDLIKSGICFRFDWLRTDRTISSRVQKFCENRQRIEDDIVLRRTGWNRKRNFARLQNPTCISGLLTTEYKIDVADFFFVATRWKRGFQSLRAYGTAAYGTGGCKVKILYDTDMILFAMAL